jgi:hypothetical protein
METLKVNIQRKSPTLSPKVPDQSRVDALTDALRDAARWLQSAGDTCGLQSLKDAAARAQATLAAVQS